MLKVTCPKCNSTKLHSDGVVEDLVECNSCGYFNYAEEFNTQPKKVPYKYHQGVNKESLLSKQLYWKGQYDK